MKESERERLDLMWSIERELFGRGFSRIAGVDEAGRGPLAGDVFAAAVILPPGFMIEGLNDSKKLSEKKREALFDVICENAMSFCVARATVAEIEIYNIRNAAYIAMNRAIDGLSVRPDIALIDGDAIKGCAVDFRCVIKGDSLSASVAAASILAKVTRDRHMKELAPRFPQYAFDKHKGYGTAAHIAAIREHGPCAEHRPSFVRKFVC